MKKFTSLIELPFRFLILMMAMLLINQELLAHPDTDKKMNPERKHGMYADTLIRGKIAGPQGPLAGVTVQVEGTAIMTTTDETGNFSIMAPQKGILVFSHAGFKSQRIPVNDQVLVNLTLVADPGNLETVVITGYRSQTRGTILGSVSSVSGSEFADVPTDNLSNSLSGRLSGVTINQPAGTPGMASNIRIRAQGGFNNQDPLFVIDGIISDKFAFDGLSPSEVETVTVLKDAASSAVYGARAANGVILVTTKRGRDGAPRLSYNGMYGIQSPTKIPEVLNAYEHASAINHQLKYINVPANDPRYYSADELEYFKTHSWNWVDEMWQDPYTTQHALDVSGGSQAVKYFLGGTYNYSSGTFSNIDYKKFNLRGNVDVNINRHLKVSLDMNTDTRHTNGPSWDVNNLRYEDLYKALLFRSAMVPPYVNGQPVGNYVEWHPGSVLAGAAGYNKRRWTSLNSTVTVNYTVPFVRGLSAKTSLNRFTRDIYQKNFNLPYNMIEFNRTGTNSHIVGDQVIGPKPRAAVEFLMSNADRIERYQFNVQLNYKRTFGKHGLDALAVYEQSEEYFTNFSARRDEFISPVVDQYIGGATTGATANGREEELGRLSYIGLVSYNYAQKYLLEGSFRYDGSPIAAAANRWGFFPSISAGWRISSEPFFEKVGFIDDLKLRASIGLLGDDNVGLYQYLQRYRIVSGAVFDVLSQGLEEDVLANPNITWETSRTYNLGLDSRFLDNKMSFKFDAFRRRSYNILGSRDASMPSTFGAPLGDENYREIVSRGVEVELGYENKTGRSNNQLNYFIRGNFGYSTNEVIKTNEPENIRDYLRQTGENTGRIFGYVATGVLRTQADIDKLPAGYTILGVAPQLGMLNYEDVRGVTSDAPDGKITVDDRQVIGQYNTAPINYGLSIGTSWKNLSIDILFQGLAGGKAMLPTAGRDIQARAEESSFRYFADSWSPDNPNGKYPGYRVTGFRTRFDESTLFLMNNSFLRMKNINVSYSLPKSVFQKAGVNSVRVFFTGSNLFMIYSGNEIYDPEMNNIQSYPMMKGFSFGLNIGL